MELTPTKEQIKSEIEEYEHRIRECRERLNLLPNTAPTFKERKKVKDTRRIILARIEQIGRMIVYAEDALNGMN